MFAGSSSHYGSCYVSFDCFVTPHSHTPKTTLVFLTLHSQSHSHTNTSHFSLTFIFHLPPLFSTFLTLTAWLLLSLTPWLPIFKGGSVALPLPDFACPACPLRLVFVGSSSHHGLCYVCSHCHVIRSSLTHTLTHSPIHHNLPVQAVHLHRVRSLHVPLFLFVFVLTINSPKHHILWSVP